MSIKLLSTIYWAVWLIGFQIVFSQKPSEEEIENYFVRIEKLVDEEIDNPNIFLNRDKLLADKSKAEGIEKVNICLDLFTYFIFQSTDKAKFYNNEASVLSSNLNFEKGTFKARYNDAYILFIEGDFDKALELIAMSFSENELSTFSEIYADFYTLKSYIYAERGEYDAALEISLNLLNKGEADADDYVLMRANSAISHIYLRLGVNEKALQYCLKGLDVILKLKQVQYLFPKIDEIARMVHKLQGSEKALEIYQFYINLEKRINRAGDYIESVVYTNIAEIYIEEEKYYEAEDILLKALELINSKGYRFRKPRAYEIMAKLYLTMKDTLKAKDSYEKGLNAAIEINAFDVVKNTSRALSELYTLTGSTLVAENFLNLHNKINDSLFSTETNQRLKIIEAQLKISEISRQKEILELKNHAQEERYRFTF